MLIKKTLVFIATTMGMYLCNQLQATNHRELVIDFCERRPDKSWDHIQIFRSSMRNATMMYRMKTYGDYGTVETTEASYCIETQTYTSFFKNKDGVKAEADTETSKTNFNMLMHLLSTRITQKNAAIKEALDALTQKNPPHIEKLQYPNFFMPETYFRFSANNFITEISSSLCTQKALSDTSSTTITWGTNDNTRALFYALAKQAYDEQTNAKSESP